LWHAAIARIKIAANGTNFKDIFIIMKRFGRKTVKMLQSLARIC
jgi:hypothetical protein